MSDPLLDILKSSIPKEDSLDFASVDSAYLDHLKNLSQSLISSERTHLETASLAIDSTLASLARKSHSQLLSSEKAVLTVCDTFKSIEQRVSQLRTSELENLQDSCDKIVEARDQGLIQSLSEGNSVVLLRNLDAVQDILELPSLTLTCVRNNYYSEALDFASHARRLTIRYGHLSIIKSIRNEINQIMQVMTVQLLNLLRETSRLPTMIKVVSYLRRLNSFHNGSLTDLKLENLFLASRLHFIRVQLSALAPLRQASSEKYLKRYIEVFREHAFASCTGFRSVFPTSDSSPEIDRLLGEFLRWVVKDLHETIAKVWPSITDASARSSLCLQIAYCSQSLGRVGGEFWPTVQAIGTAISLDEWNEAIIKQRDISQRLGKV